MEFGEISERHYIENGRWLGETFGKINGNLTYERKTGVHSLGQEEKRKYGQNGIVKQGNIPYSNEELRAIYEFSKNPDYKRRTRFNVRKIALEINRIFHNNQQARRPKSITKILLKYKERFETMFSS